MCGFRKYPGYPPQEKSIETVRGKTVPQAKILKGKCEGKLAFPEGWQGEEGGGREGCSYQEMFSTRDTGFFFKNNIR